MGTECVAYKQCRLATTFGALFGRKTWLLQIFHNLFDNKDLYLNSNLSNRPLLLPFSQIAKFSWNKGEKNQERERESRWTSFVSLLWGLHLFLNLVTEKILQISHNPCQISVSLRCPKRPNYGQSATQPSLLIKQCVFFLYISNSVSLSSEIARFLYFLASDSSIISWPPSRMPL